MLNNRIKSLRKEMGWTQNDLATKINVSQQTIGSWEVGRAEPNSEVLIKLSELFGVTVDYLLGKTDKKQIINEDNKKEYTATDLDKMLDNAMSFDGEPMSDHDREVIRAYLKGKYGK
ncbi:helix-turn-helix domain-containing protein [Enterococcus sp. AZ103]|uniref:helix-turn-helix domain-containing protein n=1 Tax=Enterococcus sp. AZ103 TaxID=2774628 RepID=UPI003F217B12